MGKASKQTANDRVLKLHGSDYLARRLLRDYMRPYRKKFFQAFVLMGVVAAATMINAYLMQPVLDDIFLRQDRTMLMIIPLVVFAIAVIKGAATYGQQVIMRVIGQRIVTDMQIQLFEHLLYADLTTLAGEASGKIVSRFTNDINILRRSVATVMTGLVKESLTLVFLVGLMFWQNPMLGLIAFGVFPVAVHPIIRLGKRMRKVAGQTLEELGSLTERLDESFRGIRVIRAYQAEDYEKKRTFGKLEDIMRLYIKAARTEAAASPIMEALAGVAIAAVIWYGGAQVIEGHTSPGSFFSFITALLMAYKPVKTISGLNTALQEGLASARRLFDLLDEKPTIVDIEGAKPLTLKKGQIAFNDITFAYAPKKPALKQLSLDVPQGKTVALVGPSGGGKSTVMNLILRFYDPQSGTIEIDGQDIHKVTTASLRSQISLVSQETVLFDDTVAANIAYGNRKASRKQIIEAAKAAAADEFISELPQGYDTPVGQGGMTLSGGQRQRISIARAMLKNAPILLLDEATSALDPISEKKVQKALKSLMEGRTTLVIAHRLSTVEEADIIYVLKRGGVVESGTHQTLIKKKGGHYAKLAKGLEE